jgi:hypothetical protein
LIIDLRQIVTAQARHGQLAIRESSRRPPASALQQTRGAADELDPATPR